MKMKILGLFILISSIFVVASCETDMEALEIQKLKTYDEQYYENLRVFKKSDHEISYAYYEAWSPLEGVEGYKDPASWGERILGLPDSIDIVNLWMGIPTPDTHPIAYQDMKFCQEKKGIRFVMHGDASHYRHKFTVDGVDYDMSQTGLTDEVLLAYTKFIVNSVIDGELDGVDIDWEGWSGTDLERLITELGKYFGPQGEDPEKLLIVDFFNSRPPLSIIPYCDYFVSQSYSNQTGGIYHPQNFPYEKMIYCESFGVFYADGGKLLDYARWEPATGHKGGCGVFFLGRNYYSSSGIPYNEFRKAIQIMNPAVK
ncbi:glycoside hydrolase family 18 [Gaoshiqia sp. Z1-71]|uniref:glycoside hydrolase family 18 n=1 Tax=Gaoshiqia hydrogeniformans TaxID=3290090 RepID=UPI003BF8BFF7